MPKFSIIIGTYNQLGTLQALIGSLNQQTFKDFEVHICDDGSNDGTQTFVENEVVPNAGGRYHYHRQEHKGTRLAKNVNQGIKAANGEYCVFVMADSILEADYLETLTQYARLDSLVCGVRIQIDMVEGEMKGVDMDWRLKKNLIPQVPSVIVKEPWNCLTGNGLTIPTEALRIYGGWCEEFEGYGGEDNDIIARLFFKGYLCWSVPDLRLYHHWHKSNEGNIKNRTIAGRNIQKYAS